MARQRGGRSEKQTGRAAIVGEGQVWAVPVPGMGFCPVVVARVPGARAEVDFAFVYLRPVLSEGPPRADSIESAACWESVWMGLVPTRPFRNGRWVLCGQVRRFDRAGWPVPPTRASAVDEAKPVEEWGEEPWGEMWSIETTADEPTMTLVANEPATRGEALRFPRAGVVTGASRLEQALATRFKNRRPGFWDMELHVGPISPELVRLWGDHGGRVRAAHAGERVEWLPAGRRTDRDLSAGAWMGLPLRGGGFGAAILVAKPERHQRVFADAVVMAMRRRWGRWPTMEDVRGLRPEDGALVAQTSMVCVRDGRWRVLGKAEAFDAEEWVWPTPWWQSVDERAVGNVSVPVSEDKSIQVQLHPEVLALDPHAGERCRGSSAYWSIEREVPCIMNGTHWDMAGTSHFPHGIVTPERILAWRKINRVVREEIAAEGWSGDAIDV